MGKKKQNTGWDKATSLIIEELALNGTMSKKVIRERILEYLKGKYDEQPLKKLEVLADDFTESVCLKLNVKDC